MAGARGALVLVCILAAFGSALAQCEEEKAQAQNWYQHSTSVQTSLDSCNQAAAAAAASAAASLNSAQAAAEEAQAAAVAARAQLASAQAAAEETSRQLQTLQNSW